MRAASQQLANVGRFAIRFPGPCGERVIDPMVRALPAALGQPIGQRGALFECPQRHPERAIDFIALRSHHAFGRRHVTDAAAKAKQPLVVEFP